MAAGARTPPTSWHLGIAALVLAPFAAEPIDQNTGRQALVHDIVEIDAGDTFAYDEAEGAATKEAREQAAADRLFGMLPEATGRWFRELWDEYERGDTAEARFVMAVDRLAPMMLNLAEGGSTWREHGITRSRSPATVTTSNDPCRMPGRWCWRCSTRRPRPGTSTPRDRVHRAFTRFGGSPTLVLGTLYS
jgi:putative hydrolase of HD superfamily